MDLAGGGTSSYIFKNGILKYRISNPGNFYWESSSVTTGFTIGTNITTPSPYPSGTYRTVIAFLDVNFSKIDTLTIIYKSSSTGALDYTKNTSGNINNTIRLASLTSTGGAFRELNINVSSVTGLQNVLVCFNNDSNAIISEISYA